MTGLFFAVGTLMITINASAQEFIVAKDGTGNFKTIGEALKATGPEGGDIIIKAGEYAEALHLEGRKAINIRAEGDVWIKPKGTANSITIVDCYNIDIRGLKFTSGISIDKCDDCIIAACLFSESASNGISVNDSRNVHIMGNQFKRCAPDGIVVRNSTKTIIVNNLFNENRSGCAIHLKEPHPFGNAEIINNTLAGNTFIPLLIDEKWEKVKISDNIIAFNTLPEKTAAITVKAGTYKVEAQRNILFNNKDKNGTVADYSGITSPDGLSVDPLFENHAAGIFTLKNTSPAIGAGTNGITIGYYQSVHAEWIKFKEEFDDAIAKYKHRQYDEAIQWFKKLLLTHSGNADVWVGLGDSYIPVKLYKDATVAYEKSMQLTPDKPEAYFGLASIHSIQHHTAEALSYLEKALQHGIYQVPVETDPNLDAIRQTDGYQKLSKQYGLQN